MPVLDNSKVMGQARAEHSVLGQREKRGKGGPARWWVLAAAGLGSSSAAAPTAPPGLCASQALSSCGLN